MSMLQRDEPGGFGDGESGGDGMVDVVLAEKISVNVTVKEAFFGLTHRARWKCVTCKCSRNGTADCGRSSSISEVLDPTSCWLTCQY